MKLQFPSCFLLPLLLAGTTLADKADEQSSLSSSFSKKRVLGALYDYEWTGFIANDGGVVDCGNVTGSLVSGMHCKDSYCDNVRLYCRYGSSIVYTGTTDWYLTPTFSEENGFQMICLNDYFMTGLSCEGQYCDNLKMKCTRTEGLTAGNDCFWSEWLSEETDGRGAYITQDTDHVIRGMECEGHYCDNKRFWVCPAIPPAGAVDDTCDYKWSDYVVSNHSVPETNNGTKTCEDPAALVVGWHCHGHYCDDIRFLCEDCGCAYPQPMSYWTEIFSEESPSVECDPDYFMTGLTCNDHYCDKINMQCTKHEGRKAGNCVVTEWMSEEGDGTIIFDEKMYIRGVECRGHYCDDKRFKICPAVDESNGCPTEPPTAAPVLQIVDDPSCTPRTINFDSFAQGEFVSDLGNGVNVVGTIDGVTGNRAQIFDTAEATGGDVDLTMQGDIGHVLILAENNVDIATNPDDNSKGGLFEFTFGTPVKIVSLGILDTDSGPNSVTTTRTDDSTTMTPVPTTNDGDLQTVELDATDVIKLDILLSGSAAIHLIVVEECGP